MGLRICSVVALTVGLAVLAGCSGGDVDETALTPIVGSDSAYCQTYRAWKVYELDARGAFDQPNPAALRRWWNAYVIAEETMLREAPPEIGDAVGAKVGHIRSVLSPLMEKYDFDLDRMRREGSADEQAALYGPSPGALDKAQEAQYAYEVKTCGTAPTPPAAEVAFEDGPSSKSFCSAIAAFDVELEKVASARFDPEAMRTLVTGTRFTEALDGLDETAPTEVAEDVQADTEWFRTRWSDVVAAYDYDLRRIWVEATPEDLAVFNRSHPDVLEHTSRTTAYEDQICMG